MLSKILSRNFSTSLKKDIGFVGIGNMGYPMVLSLMKHGHRVTVFDVNQQKLQEAEAEGATVAPDVAELAKDKDACISILPTPKIVRETLAGKGGIFENAREGTLVVDSSTIGPDEAIYLSKQADKHRVRFADVPVSGGYMGAKNGTLTCIIGAKQQDYQEVEELFSPMGSSFFH